MNTAFTLEPDDDGLITVTAAYTPSDCIHDPESAYVRYYSTPILGPLSVLTFIHLNSWITADDATITLHYDEFAHSLGSRPPRLTRSLQRLNAFHLAHTLAEQPATLYIRRRVPTLNARQLAPLNRRFPPLVATDPKRSLVDADRESAHFIKPRADLAEHGREHCGIKVSGRNSEVEVFGEPVRLEPALPKAGPPFEGPPEVRVWRAIPASSQPST